MPCSAPLRKASSRQTQHSMKNNNNSDWESLPCQSAAWDCVSQLATVPSTNLQSVMSPDLVTDCSVEVRGQQCRLRTPSLLNQWGQTDSRARPPAISPTQQCAQANNHLGQVQHFQYTSDLSAMKSSVSITELSFVHLHVVTTEQPPPLPMHINYTTPRWHSPGHPSTRQQILHRHSWGKKIKLLQHNPPEKTRPAGSVPVKSPSALGESHTCSE